MSSKAITTFTIAMILSVILSCLALLHSTKDKDQLNSLERKQNAYIKTQTTQTKFNKAILSTLDAILKSLNRKSYYITPHDFREVFRFYRLVAQLDEQERSTLPHVGSSPTEPTT